MASGGSAGRCAYNPTGDKPTSRWHLRRATARCGDGADTRITLAFAELALGRQEAAKAIIDAALPHPDAAMLAAAMTQHAGHPETAIATLAKPFALESEWWLPAELH